VYFNVSAAEKLTVYRWIDKENVVHFSQNQPNHDDYIEISMANNQKSSAIIDKKSSPGAPQPNDNLLAESNGKNEVRNDDLSNDKCVAALDNLKTLQNFDNIQYKDENGKVKVLSALEKQQQLAMNTKQSEVYCKD
tara:strand:+ start:471 stop:878 length:408 start_codon:yes stop_codon:yes gene_type:complete